MVTEKKRNMQTLMTSSERKVLEALEGVKRAYESRARVRAFAENVFRGTPTNVQIASEETRWR